MKWHIRNPIKFVLLCGRTDAGNVMVYNSLQSMTLEEKERKEWCKTCKMVYNCARISSKESSHD